MNNASGKPTACVQFRHFDPLTGTVPPEHGPTFMGLADQARQILRRRSREEICAAGCIIGGILNSREERRLDLTTDRLVRIKGQTITAARELRKVIGKKEIIDRPGFSNATRAEYFAVLALYLIGECVALIRDPPVESRYLDKSKLGTWHLAIAGEYAAAATEAVTVAQLHREMAPVARVAVRKHAKTSISARYAEARKIKERFYRFYASKNFPSQDNAAREFLQTLTPDERRSLHKSKHSTVDSIDQTNNEVRTLLRSLRRRLKLEKPKTPRRR